MYKGSLFSPPSSLVAYGLFDGADYTLYTIEIESASFKTVSCKCQVSTVFAYMPDESFSERFPTTERRAGREGLPW